MATILDVMLEAAREMGQVYEGTASSGTTSSLTDNYQTDPADHYAGGTIWFLTGDHEGECARIKAHDGNTFTFEEFAPPIGEGGEPEETADPIAAGDEYAVATADYPRQKLKQAVLSALRNEDYLQNDDTLEVLEDTAEYDLPVGVSRVMAVEIATADEAPYGWVLNMNWREWDGRLIFATGKQPIMVGKKIRLWYAAPHGAIAESATIKPGINLEWLKWKAVEWLWRDKIIHIREDNVNLQLLNEAKQKEIEARNTAKSYELRRMNPTPRLSNY